MESTETLEAQNAQRESAKRATLDAMRGKRRAEKELSVILNEGDEPVTFLLKAISATAYDKLITDHPPTKDQLAQGGAFNVNTFGPALIAAVFVEPSFTTAQWTEFWNSEDWSGGEISGFFREAMALCNRGLSLGPTAAD